jgi:hypothetical protein
MYDCAGNSLGIDTGSSYTIDDVSPDTSGDFTVTADVHLDDGSIETVEFDVTDGSSGQTCLGGATVTSTTPAAPVEPADVPSLPSAGDEVPEDSALPDSPSSSDVLSYDDPSTWPTSARQLVEWKPDGLTASERAAVSDIIGFLVRINQQRFQAAWDLSTERLTGSHVASSFVHGYVTTHHYQVAFGQPRQLARDLIAVPGRFVSRQDPAAQGSPEGMTDCSYWPQYVWVVAHRNGRWLVDVAGIYHNRRELRSIQRPDASGRLQNSPSNQRVSC